MLRRFPERPAQSRDANEPSPVVERPFAVDVCLGIPGLVPPHYLTYRNPDSTPVKEDFPIPGKPNNARPPVYIRQTLVNPCGFCRQETAIERVIGD